MSTVAARRKLSVFQFGIKKWQDEVGELPEVLVKKIAIDLYTAITLRTPVDTGRARASWRLSVGQPDNEIELERTKTGTGSKAKGNLEPENRAEITEFNESSGEAINNGAFVYINNGLDYIEFLEGGSSDQAPAGMVAISIAELKAGLRVEGLV